MAKLKVLLEIGQSNASPIGDIKSWEDAMSQVAIRSSSVNLGFIPQYSQGAYSDTWTMDQPFPGGPTVDRLGATVGGSWQTVNIRGVAIDGVLQPVFYNATPAYFDYLSWTESYPGSFRVAPEGQGRSTPTRLYTNHRTQPAQEQATCTSTSGTTLTCSGGHGLSVNDLIAVTGSIPSTMSELATYIVTSVSSNDFEVEEWLPVMVGSDLTIGTHSTSFTVHKCSLGTITRRDTGTTHAAASGGPTAGSAGKSVINTNQPILPPPREGEVFEFVPTIGDTGTGAYTHNAAGPILLRTRFGGLCDSGDLAFFSEALTVQTSRTSGEPIRFVSDTVPMYVGRTCQIQNPTSAPRVITMPGAGTDITVTTTDWRIGDAWVYVGATGGGFTSGNTYYVVDITHDAGTGVDTIQLSATKGGTAATTPGSGVAGVYPALPAGVTHSAVYYVSRTERLGYPKTMKALAVTLTAAGAASGTITAVAHGLRHGSKVQLTGSMPSEFDADHIYYVQTVDADSFTLSSTPQMTDTVTYTASSSIILALEVYDSLVAFYLSASPGGPELTSTDTDHSASRITFKRSERFEGSLAGVKLRCLTGANAGESVTCKHIQYTGQTGGAADHSLIHHEESWGTTPTDGDTFILEPPPLADGTLVPWEKWCQILPWSPFEGRAQGQAIPTTTTFSRTMTTDDGGLAGAQVAVTIGTPQVGQAVKFFTTGQLPHRLVPGQVYYTTYVAGLATYFSASYDGTEIVTPFIEVASVSGSTITFSEAHNAQVGDAILFGDVTGITGLTAATTYYVDSIVSSTAVTVSTARFQSFTRVGSLSGTPDGAYAVWPGFGTHYSEMVHAEERTNPFPPGFNMPTNRNPVPATYQPFAGPQTLGNFGISSGMTVALKQHDYYGDAICHVCVAFGGTSLGNKEVIPGSVVAGEATGTATISGKMWYDPKQQLSWSPEAPNGCYQRLEDTLDGINYAVAQSDKWDGVEVVLVSWVQGEEDARIQELADDYEVNLRKFKAKVRQLIVDKGMWTGEAAHIPWVQPKVYTAAGTWAYADTVNTAIDTVTNEDPWAETVPVTSLSLLSDLYETSSDVSHYNGAAMHLLGELIYGAWRSIVERESYSRVQIGNLALANLGDKATITSLTDGSRQATLVSQFYDLALKTTMSRHPWDFALKRVSPTAVTVDRTEWLYSYYLPSDYKGVFAVLPKEPTDDTVYGGKDVRLEYAIEYDTTGTRRLYCNQADVVLRYWTDIVDPSRYSEPFVEALSWKLSELMAPALVKGEEGVKAAQAALQMFEHKLRLAASRDADTTRKRFTYRDQKDTFDRARGNGSTRAPWDDCR